MTDTFKNKKIELLVLSKQLQSVIPNAIQTICSQFVAQHLRTLIDLSSPNQDPDKIFTDIYLDAIVKMHPIILQFTQKMSEKFSKRSNKYSEQLAKILFPTPEQVSSLLLMLAQLISCCHSQSEKNIEKLLQKYKNQISPLAPEVRRLTQALTDNFSKLLVQLNVSLKQTLQKSLDTLDSHYTDQKNLREIKKIRCDLIASVVKNFTPEYLSDLIWTFSLLPNLLIVDKVENNNPTQTLTQFNLKTNPNKAIASNPEFENLSQFNDFTKELTEEFLLNLGRKLAQDIEKDLQHLIKKLMRIVEKELRSYQASVDAIETLHEKPSNPLTSTDTSINKHSSLSENSNFDIYCTKLAVDLKNNLAEQGGKTYVSKALINTGVFKVKDFENLKTPQRNSSLGHGRHLFFRKNAISPKSIDITIDEHKILTNQPQRG